VKPATKLSETETEITLKKLKYFICITQQMQKKALMDKLEDDLNGLQLRFLKTCLLVFQSTFLLFETIE